jgi:hypothetical protein
MRWTAPFVAFSVFAVMAAFSSPVQAQTDVEVSHGGWAATGGTLVWMSAAPFMQLAVKSILAPDDPEVCDITPARCQPDWIDYTLAGLTIGGTVAVTAVGGWATGKLAEELELDAGLGWGISGGIVGIPIFGMLWLSIPKMDPAWLDTTLGTIFTFGGAIGSGFYFAEIAGKRGHAWPEFGFGFGGVLLGAGLGSLFCGGEACAATPLGGAIGGILGVGLSTLVWGTSPSDDARPAMQAIEQQPLIHYEMNF